MTLEEFIKYWRNKSDSVHEIAKSALTKILDAAELSIELEKANDLFYANIQYLRKQLEKLEAENKILKEAISKIRSEAEAPNPDCLGEDGSIGDYIGVIRACDRIARDVLEKLK
ncbi:MAG: hypothetical protein SFW66_08985 [Gammaproteobacteria bacterium]|nr:hypothetical protein [Gammaproteobacteria bacterium]